MRDKILVIAPHPDDETLGCGGTLLKYKARGAEVSWVIVTNIAQVRGWEAKRVEERQKEIDKVSKLYGFDSVFKLDFPTTELDATPINRIITALSKVILKIKPNIVYLPNKNDIHTDHQVTFTAGMSCTKNFRVPFINKILMYECLSETEFAPALEESAFVPNIFVDISNLIARKIEIMKVYGSEIKEHPWPRSIENIKALATFRGAACSFRYAESFMLLKEINR